MKIAIIVAFRRPPQERAAAEPPYHPDQHSERCRQRREAFDRYATDWPNHCPTCHGAGEVSYSEDPGARDCSLSAGSMTFADPCDCVMEDRCPRCAKSLLGSWLRHPRRRLARVLREAASLDWALRAAMLKAITPALYASSPSVRMRDYAVSRLGGLLSRPSRLICDPLWDLAEWVAPMPADEPPTCEFCGWTGTDDGDVQPPWECLCYEEHEAEQAELARAGAICWRCEQPFDGQRPSVQAKIAIFGLRWLHPGCLFTDERAIEPPTPDTPTA
ncbi:MAG: hypothetical protein HGA45_34940 [Chloroflexales bacterium]|nr:hypothetical protein [Chloroflexales bacterium]